MIKNMLIAASKMLERSSIDEELHIEFSARVSCAKTVIDEIISSLDMKYGSVEEVEDFPPPKIPITKDLKKGLSPKEFPKGLEPEIGVKDGRLVEIKNVPLDGLIELDNKKMSLQDAIGKTFNNINILWRP